MRNKYDLMKELIFWLRKVKRKGLLQKIYLSLYLQSGYNR